MTPKNKAEKLAKFLDYVLGRHPDEFGLVPDEHGYVKIKELLKALAEEDGWGYVRRGHFNEILLIVTDAPIEIEGERIRAKNRGNLPMLVPDSESPGLLYTAIRKKAHAVVLTKGILPMGLGRVVLSADRRMAERIGKRIDADPVILTVHVANAKAEGAVFDRTGESLYLTDYIGPSCFTGPPLPKERPEAKKPEKPEKDYRRDMAGTFILEPKSEGPKKPRNKRERQRKEIDWKKERRQQKKQKKGFDNPF